MVGSQLLHQLSIVALDWVTASFDVLCVKITSELQSGPYAELKMIEAVQYEWPDADTVHKNRPEW